MGRTQKIGLIAAAVVVVVVAIIVIQGGDDSSDNGTTSTTQTAAGSKPAAPAIQTITVKDGKAVGGVQEIEANKDETVEFKVTSDADHEIHLHGYDVAKDVKAGGSVTYKFKATIEGIFEIEIEDLKEQIANLRVNP